MGNGLQGGGSMESIDLTGEPNAGESMLVPRREYIERRAGGLSLPWPWVSGFAALLAVAATASLVLIVGLRSVDVLSAVALSLAIVAFIVQIVVFMFQAWTSNQHTSQSREVNAQTKTLLEVIGAETKGVQAILKDQFDRVLTSALSETPKGIKPAASDAGEVVGELRERFKSNVDRAFDAVTLPRQTITDPSARVQVTVRLPVKTAESLRMLAERQGTTVTDQIVRAISLYATVNDSVIEGARLLVQMPDGRSQELVIA